MDAITLTDNLTCPPMSASWLHEGLRMASEVSLDRDHSDYVLVRDTIQFISERWRDQPELETIAAAVGTDASHLHRLFTRWAGLTPKAFVQALTLDEARRMLDQSSSILDTAYEVGLSGPGRLHDLFVTHEAMSPGAYKARGAGVTVAYGFHSSPFGTALVMAGDSDPICSLAATAMLSEGLPNVRTEIFSQASHFFLMEQPEKFMALLSGWLDGQGGERRTNQ